MCDGDKQRVVVFAGNRRRALDWLRDRGIDGERREGRFPDAAILLVVHPDELDHTMAGLAFDLTGFIFASGPLRRAMEARRERFHWLTEAEFLHEVRR
ncbi:MAG TPA: hypothetical protein VEA80_06655 [Vitreimonas sp.]|uniref:hypothetical protein n=1 Tax=Vitreimonas sp. TaxID=3069702 RepID=UPI002D63F5C5|nr:hypothetical protein [Vitreimonas sp.]HYD87134.1 hypothetical protein [Vitreimonas sp.]